MSDEEFFEFECGYFPDKVAQEIVDGIPNKEGSQLLLEKYRPDLLRESDKISKNRIQAK